MAKSVNGIGGQAGESEVVAQGETAPVATSSPAKAAEKVAEKPARNLADAEGVVTAKSLAKALAECCRTRPMSPEVAQEAKRINSSLHRQMSGTSSELGAAMRKFYADPTPDNGEEVAKLADEIAKAK